MRRPPTTARPFIAISIAIGSLITRPVFGQEKTTAQVDGSHLPSVVEWRFGRTYLLTVLLIAFAAPVNAQDIIGARDSLTERIDAIFRAFDRSNSPGCAVGIMRDGRLVYARGYGMANLEHRIPITPATVFGLESVTKQFTAAAILLLAQQRRLSLDDNVRMYVPELADFETPITLRHLIHHTSGLRFFPGADGRDEALDWSARLTRPNFTPGDYHQYSNFGYALLALVVERVSGQSLRDFAHVEIFEPLGMKSTFFQDDAGAIIANLAYEYLPTGDGGFQRVPGVISVHLGPAGLYSTVEDLARWDRNFYEDRIGRPGLVAQLQERGALNSGERLTYAFGLNMGEYRGLPVVGHGGEGNGYRTGFRRFPEQRVSVAVLCNGGAAFDGQLDERVADAYLEHEFGEPLATPAALDDRIVRLPPEQLERVAGLYWNRESRTRYRFSVQDETLWLSVPDANPPRGPYEMEALSPTRFLRPGNPNFEWRFEEAVADAPARATFTRRVPPGRSLVFEAVDDFSPAGEELTGYAGLYLGDEVDVLFRVQVNGDSLILGERSSGRVTLVPLFRDAFRAPYSVTGPYSVVNRGWVLEFRRDANGRVTGVVFTNGRGDFHFTRLGAPSSGAAPAPSG